MKLYDEAQRVASLYRDMLNKKGKVPTMVIAYEEKDGKLEAHPLELEQLARAGELNNKTTAEVLAGFGEYQGKKGFNMVMAILTAEAWGGEVSKDILTEKDIALIKSGKRPTPATMKKIKDDKRELLMINGIDHDSEYTVGYERKDKRVLEGEPYFTKVVSAEPYLEVLKENGKIIKATMNGQKMKGDKEHEKVLPEILSGYWDSYQKGKKLATIK